MEGEYDYLQGQPEQKQKEREIADPKEKQEKFEARMLLQRDIMEYAMRTQGITGEEWVEKYAPAFSEYYSHSDVAEIFEKNWQDNNPEEFYKGVQSTLESVREDLGRREEDK